jgi:putative endonuclease
MIGWLLEAVDRLRHRARKNRWSADRTRGRRGEDLAHRHLRSQGYTVVARNWRTRSGSAEVDLVAWEGETLVFVEVKTRTTDEYGSPDRAIDGEKRRHIARAARDYARRAGVDWGRVRFDVVNVIDERPPVVQLLRNAFRVRDEAILIPRRTRSR